MTSRERVQKALNHIEPDRVPFDLNSTAVTGISATSLTLLKKAYNIYNEPVKIYEPYQILGDIDLETIKAFEIDLVGVGMPYTIFGYKNENWKPWKLPNGIDAQISENFRTIIDSNGDLLVFPEGDTSCRPSARMPKDGFYFDTIIRQEEIIPEKLNPKDWIDGQISLYKDEDLKLLENQTSEYYNNTDLALMGNFGQGGIGDIAHVPGPGNKNPKGIRNPEEWYIAHLEYPEYIKGIYALQTEIAIKNLHMFKDAVGNKIEAIFVSGTDFGTQRGPYISPDMYREFFKPFHKQINDWIHQNTTWKTFFHSCGSVVDFLDDFIDAGVDILNPVQCSAKGMEPEALKNKYGDKLVFWGGGIDTQKTLPFGSPEEIKQEVKTRMQIFGKGGGYVFNPIHNVQAGTPIENLLALLEAIKEYRII